MADSPITAYSPWQALSGFPSPSSGGGGGAPAAGSNDVIANMVSALMKKFQGDGSQPMTGFEGNVASPANPYDSGSYGMQSPATPPAQPAAPPLSGQQPMQSSQWGQGTQTTPFLNGSALFGQPPIG